MLYRYQSFDGQDQNLQALRESYLWFSSARHFNDPFDSALTFSLEVNDPALRERWAVGVVQRDSPDWTEEQCRDHARTLLNELDNNPILLKERQDIYIETNYQKFGMCSLSAVDDNILLWAHYAQGHTGFVIGIDTNCIREIQNSLAVQKELLDLRPIIYASEVPAINFFESMLSPAGEEDIIQLLMTKSDQWSYEQEYRFIYWDNVDFGLQLPPNCISEVILGCRISSNDETHLREALETSSINTRVLRAHKHEQEFGLIIRDG